MSENNDYQRRKYYRGGASGPIYGFAFIGALIYFIQHATTFWMGVLGFFKAVFWPAFLIYKIFDYFKM
jgi:hypothetical protein